MRRRVDFLWLYYCTLDFRKRYHKDFVVQVRGGRVKLIVIVVTLLFLVCSHILYVMCYGN